DASRAAPGDERAHRHDRRARSSARRRLHGHRDAEPDRAARNVSAARGAAGPFSLQAARRVPGARRRDRNRAAARQPVGDAAPRGLRDRAGHRSAGPARHPRRRRTDHGRRSRDRVHRRRRARDARAREPGFRRLDALGEHARRRIARVRGAAGPRLRHPRRREGAGVARAAPSRDAERRCGDRRLDRRSHLAPNARSDARSALMRPTRRAVALFAAALPIPWILLAVAARAWPFALDASVLVLVALASDALLSYPRRRLQVHVTPVDAAFVGTAVEVTVTLGIGAGRRPPAFQALLEASGDADPVVTPGLRTIGARDESATFAVVPRRRGILSIDAV